MKHGTARILHQAQEDYLVGLLPPRDALVREMEEQAAREDIPISDPEVAILLSVLARSLGARRIVEVGTAIGYAALLLARAAPEARITTIDIDPARLAIAQAFLSRGGVAERVELLEGRALDILPDLEGPFDLAYVDAVKGEYRRYLDLLLPRLRVGGLIVLDNVLWSGEVADPPAHDEQPESIAFRSFNPYFMIHPQLEALILPIGDGVGLGTKKRPLRSELGGTG